MTTFTHKELAINCFNAAWDLLDLNVRTKDEEEQMIHLTHSSFWHWSQVEDHTPKNLSIGYWQLARVYAVCRMGERSLYFAKCCEDISLKNNLEPFYIAYAYEAISRANAVLGNIKETIEYKAIALEYTQKVKLGDSKEMLFNDLESINY
jgi:hypothetical protein